METRHVFFGFTWVVFEWLLVFDVPPSYKHHHRMSNKFWIYISCQADSCRGIWFPAIQLRWHWMIWEMMWSRSFGDMKRPDLFLRCNIYIYSNLSMVWGNYKKPPTQPSVHVDILGCKISANVQMFDWWNLGSPDIKLESSRFPDSMGPWFFKQCLKRARISKKTTGGCFNDSLL